MKVLLVANLLLAVMVAFTAEVAAMASITPTGCCREAVGEIHFCCANCCPYTHNCHEDEDCEPL